MDYDVPKQPTNRPGFHLDLPEHPAPIRRDRKSLLIALVVSFIFLVAALGVAGWLVFQKLNAPAVEQPQDTTKTKDVKKVTWVAPVIPTTYTMREQNNSVQTKTYYYDAAAACGITSIIDDVDSLQGDAIKEALINAINAEAAGITITTATDGAEYTITDQNAETYPFESMQLQQKVAVEGVAYTAQTNLVVYRQFGDHVASLSAFCKTDSWEAKKAELEQLIKTFTVKVE